MSEGFPEPKTEKPPVLFHASPRENIEIFEPRNLKTRIPGDTPHVFATPDKGYASAFLTEWDDSWAQLFNFEGVVVMVISDRERFMQSDKGGTLYELPSDNFSNVSPDEEDHPEWQTDQAIRPIGNIHFQSALEAMIENGVQVFFVTPDEFKEIDAAEDNGVSILTTLESENQKRRTNIKSLRRR